MTRGMNMPSNLERKDVHASKKFVVQPTLIMNAFVSAMSLATEVPLVERTRQFFISTLKHQI